MEQAAGDWIFNKTDSSKKYRIKWATADNSKWAKTSERSLSTITNELKRAKSKVRRVEIDGAAPPEFHQLLPDITHLCIKGITADQVASVLQR